MATQINSFWVSDFPCLTHVAHPACALLIPCCPVCRCSFSCVCTLLSDSRSPNHHACRQYCDAQKLGVSYTPNASLHYHNQTSAGTQTYPTPLTPQSLSALLPKPHKYPSKHLSRSLSKISFIFRSNAQGRPFQEDPGPFAWPPHPPIGMSTAMFTIYNVFSHFPGKARYALFWPKILIPPP